MSGEDWRTTYHSSVKEYGDLEYRKTVVSIVTPSKECRGIHY